MNEEFETFLAVSARYVTFYEVRYLECWRLTILSFVLLLEKFFAKFIATLMS